MRTARPLACIGASGASTRGRDRRGAARPCLCTGPAHGPRSLRCWCAPSWSARPRRPTPPRSPVPRQTRASRPWRRRPSRGSPRTAGPVPRMRRRPRLRPEPTARAPTRHPARTPARARTPAPARAPAPWASGRSCLPCPALPCRTDRSLPRPGRPLRRRARLPPSPLPTRRPRRRARRPPAPTPPCPTAGPRPAWSCCRRSSSARRPGTRSTSCRWSRACAGPWAASR